MNRASKYRASRPPEDRQTAFASAPPARWIANWLRRMARSTAFLLVATASATAQSVDSTDHVRETWGWQAGVLRYGTGDDFNCGTGGGLSAGVEARTREPWFGAAGLDLLLASSLGCSSAGRIAQHEGETVYVSGRTELLGAPRLRVRGGRAVPVGAWWLEPSFGMGLIYGVSDFSGGNEWTLNGWAGLAVALRGREHPVGVELEYGMHQVPIRYYPWGGGTEAVHEFRRWKPMSRISIVF